MDTAQWAQGIGVVKPMESSRPAVLERKTIPQKDQALINCPRCNSTNTKFCYYNNYSLSQPRYFCKTCRRYWTEGGSLRNVPVGGGSRKNKRASASSLSANSTAPSLKKLSSTTDQLTVPVFPSLSTTQSSKIYKNHQDLNLAYPPADLQDYSTLSKFEKVPYASTDHEKSQSENPNSSSATSHQSHLSSIELLKTGIASRGLGSFMGLPASDQPSTMFSDGYSLQDIKPSLNFSLEGFENRYGTRQGMQGGTGARLLFPVEELNKQVPDTTELDQSRSQSEQASGYWNGVLGGGPW